MSRACRWRRAVAVWTLAGMGSIVVARAGELALAERGGAPDRVIVVATAAPLPTRHAAEELRDWTERLTGVRLAIVTDDRPLPAKAILLGITRHTSGVLGADATTACARLGEDGFRLVAKPPHLVVLGSHVRGTLYGVYELLETHGGIGWFAPWHTVVPQAERLAVPEDLDDEQRPAFALRETLWYDTRDGDFASRLRLNGNFQRLEAKHGGHSHRFSHALGNCHTFYRLVPPERYFAAHPEYYSLVNGKRTAENAQLCLTNPEVLAIATSNVLTAIRREPQARYFGVSQNDCQRYCECPACRAVDEEEGSHAGTIVRFVNAIAEEVEKRHPDKVIETLAYNYSRKPPRKTRLRRNVMPCLCVIECDYARPIPESTQPATREFCDYFRGWSAQTDKLYVWDYTVNFRHYPHAMPNVYALQGNIRFFRENHVVSLFAQGDYQGRHAGLGELKVWLLAKWMWNPDLEMKPLLDRFFAGYYGKAAPFVRTYFEELHERQRRSATPLKIYDDPVDSCMDAAFLERAAGLWRQAAEAVKDEPAVYGYNVRMGEFSTAYTRFMQCARPLDATLAADGSHAGDQKALARLIFERMAEAKDIRISEHKHRHDTFCYRVKVAMESGVAGQGGIAGAPVTALHVANREKAFVDDPRSGYGKSLRLTNANHEWYARYQLSDLAYDAGARYVFRLKVRAQRRPDAPDGRVVWAGVYDERARKSICADLHVTAGQLNGAEWTWFESAPFVPNDRAYLWIAPGRFDDTLHKINPAMEAAFVEVFEFRRLPDGNAVDISKTGK